MRFLIFAFLLIASNAQARTEIRVREFSTVKIGDPIRLGVLITGEIKDPSLAEKIQDLVVFDSIPKESIKMIGSQELAIAMRKKLSFTELQQLQLVLPEVIKVKAVHNYLYPSDIRHQVKQQALRSCAPCEVYVEDLIVPDTAGVGEILNWRLDLAQVKKFASFVAPLIIETSKGRQTFFVTGKMSLLKEALVSRRLIKYGESINETDVESRKVNIAFAQDGLVSPKDLQGRVANRVIAVGQPLFWSDLKQELAARRGDQVKIQFGDDVVEIMTLGTAEEAGSVGDRIKVKTASNNKILSGVLVEPGLVRIE